MEIGLHYPPLMGSSKEILAGMPGQRTDLYQRMLKNLLERLHFIDAFAGKAAFAEQILIDIRSGSRVDIESRIRRKDRRQA